MNLPITLSLIAFVVILAACIYFYIQSKEEEIPERVHYKLSRHDKNPVLSPLPFREWEACGTFNPAAFKDDEGGVHLLYRAVGGDGLSRVGYASSKDGKRIDYRSPYPVFEPIVGYGMPDPAKVSGPMAYNPAMYTSGGGWGGSEDPRTVRIGDRVYMSYVAFEGWNSVRIALTSIHMDDLKHRRWKWRRPQLISPAGEVNKNWLIFPEKINGRFAILHSIVPDVKIAFVDNLDYIPKEISSPRPQGVQPGRKKFWDNKIRGAGPPPIKTEIGWLLLYHAIDHREPSKYKLGAMILDVNDPTKVIYRSPQPILAPDAHYENDGKPGVVYASGAVMLGDNLMVYYGGGDKHICIAETPLKALLDWMVKYGKV
jgi:predicted GH43/DUF377 family glycosyl hydrolase